jgi:hypothetical protein
MQERAASAVAGNSCTPTSAPTAMEPEKATVAAAAEAPAAQTQPAAALEPGTAAAEEDEQAGGRNSASGAGEPSQPKKGMRR